MNRELLYIVCSSGKACSSGEDRWHPERLWRSPVPSRVAWRNLRQSRSSDILLTR